MVLSSLSGRRSIIILAVLVLSLALGSGAPAANAAAINVTIDGQTLEMDVSPVIAQGRTLVPFRDIFEHLGASVGWDEASQSVTGTTADKVITLYIGSTTALIDGAPVPLDVPAMIVNGRTMVPGRFVAESLGGTADWDQTTGTVIIVSGAAAQPEPAAELAVHFIDVGQGDAILIRAPDKAVLIDGGERGATALNYLQAQGTDKLDLVIGTHPHSDHIGGLIDVLAVLPVAEVMDPGVVHTSEVYEEYLTLIDEKDILFTIARAGMSRDLGNGIILQVYHPVQPDDANLNDASVVAKVTYGTVSFLFTGDAEAASEAQMLLRSDISPPATVLKIGHHGSNSSTSDAFLELVDSEAAVIMVGKGNPYGHPHAETLAKLAAAGVTVYRTDTDGTIVITTDGRTYEVRNNPLPPAEPVPEPAPAARININTAGFEELQQIIHIGPERAQAIIELRPFTSLDDLIRVPGLGPEWVQEIKAEGKASVG